MHFSAKCMLSKVPIPCASACANPTITTTNQPLLPTPTHARADRSITSASPSCFPCKFIAIAYAEQLKISTPCIHPHALTSAIRFARNVRQ